MPKYLTLAAALLGASAMAAPAQAQTADYFVPETAGTFLVRARAINVSADNNGSWTSVGGHIDATSQVTPEVDFTYFLTPNIAFELIAATTSHLLSVRGAPGLPSKIDVGSTSVLPPTLTVQYHFLPDQRFSPYVGAGINYTFFYNTEPSHALGLVNHVSLTNNFGYALQAGLDYAIAGPWVANIDVKQIFLHTTASVDEGLIRAKTNLDPLVVGVGVGYKF
jgi:outer membrane protein